MIFKNKTFLISVVCGIVFSSAFAFVTSGAHFSVPEALPEQVSVPADTTKNSTSKFPVKKLTQNTYEDINKQYPMDLKNPDNVKSVVEYDSKSGNYVFKTFVGENEIATPFMMTPQEYRSFSARQDMQLYWKEKNSKAAKNNEDKFNVTDMKFNIGAADKVFGPGGVQIKTQGSAEILFGFKTNSVQNPALTERMRKSNIFDFDEKIQLNVTGQVGDKVNFGLNYNTEASFDFDQKMVKLAYKGKEDDIIKNIEAGNVSMQLNSSLISGSTALFGVKTELQFGRLNVSAIASQQESQTQTVSSKGGAQTTKFEVNIDAYEDNRHFFLGHFFRNNYEKSMSKLPFISSGVTVNRVEVWVINKRGNFDQARNILAFMDLGENSAKDIDNPWWKPNAVNAPQNKANTLYDEINTITNIRNVQLANSSLQDYANANAMTGFNGGEDYEKIESARRLDPSEYSLNASLGYISLRSTLNPDEVLGVSYEYSYGGQVYQVGEFSTDAIAAPQALIVKLLKSTSQSTLLKTWDLMMKNVYNLGAMQIMPDNFKLNVVYRNDSIGTDMQYITEGSIKNKLLLRVMNLDNLDSKQVANPDGKYDYVEGYTVQSSNGRIIFPILEPFGSHLATVLDPNYDPQNPQNLSQLAKKYVYQELYDSTLIVAQEYSEKNKFRLTGEYSGSASASEIKLNAMNVPRGSVTVTAGGATLVENVDYTVDYTMGTVNIINQSLVSSGTKIDVKLENQSNFSMQRKSLTGAHLEYKFNKDFSLGGTVMHLSEMPLTTKVNTGYEPISNTIWGVNTAWRTESQWLTNVLDKIPFVNATKPSTLAINAEFAQLIPGHSKVVSNAGLAYLDDFESTKTTIDIHYPINWFLASTPTQFAESKFSNNVDYGKNRALLNWYYVDPLFNQKTAPKDIKNNPDAQSNHLTREVKEQEIFPNKQTSVNMSSRLTIMNLSYYPEERGPYNLDVSPTTYSKGLDLTTGKLKDPKTRWGGIMRKIDATDFETSNIEYIEFWMLDPFVNGQTSGGQLYFNLGDISEDILKDGKKSFENGLSPDGSILKTDTTAWGRISKTQSTVNAFDNTPGARLNQDVGLDGLTTVSEFDFPAYKDYVQELNSKLDANAKTAMANDPFSPLKDPAGDNYHFYRGTDYDNGKVDIISRYKRYNGTEGNSPDASNVGEAFGTSSSSLPDQEDINTDNTLSEYEKYFVYKVDLRPGKMGVGQNKYVTDQITSDVKLINGKTEKVTWYQFKIPIRNHDDKVGSIRNFKSIRFIRMYLTDFDVPTTLRFATLDLVRGEWRAFNKPLNLAGTAVNLDGKLDVQAVNFEENTDKKPVNYILPPGITRETDPGQPQLLQQNEQSMLLRVNNLAPKDARAVYKNTNFDMRQYKRLQMFVHAEKMLGDVTGLQSHDLTCFIRMGSDMVNNYYEYEIPLRLTPEGNYLGSKLSDRETVWYPENMFDFSFQTLTNLKLKRNKTNQTNPSSAPFQTPFEDFDPAKPNNKISIVGNPSLSEVSNIMIGIRNRSTNVKSGEIWVNELRMSEFDESGGWAAMANVAVGLSDLGSVNFSGRTESAGYGSLESNVTNRRMDDLYQMNFSTALELGRFLPEQAKIQLPAYFSYTNETLSPKYNPLDQDILLTDALNNLNSQQAKDSLNQSAQTVNSSRSFNVTGAKVNIKSKTPQFYDPANVNFTYAYSETTQHNPEIEQNLTKDEKAAVTYSYSFNSQPWEPFKKVKAFDSPVFKIIKEFNLNYLPASMSFNTNMNRRYSHVKLRDLNSDMVGVSAGTLPMNVSFSRDFMWNRQFDIKYDITRALKLSFQSAMNATIIEPFNKTPELNPDYYKEWRDSVWSNIRKLGSPYTYQQVFTASWNLPINKIPMLDWITSNASYNSTYDWNRMARVQGMAEIGNTATSMGAWQADASLNFETLYNKSAYLKEVNDRYASQLSNVKPKFQAKNYTQVLKFEKNKTTIINHRLGSNKFTFKVLDKNGKLIPLKYKQTNNNTLEIIPPVSADSVQLSMSTLDPNDQPVAKTAVDFTVRALMMVRRASVTYRQSSSMVLPGFRSEPGFMGQQTVNGLSAPGYPFTFGFHDKGTIQSALDNGWLTNDTTIVNPATMAYTADLDFRATIEPIAGLKIDLSAKRYESSNTSVQYMFKDPISNTMPSTFNGSYNITLVAIGTAFKSMGSATQNYSSELFNNFLANRDIVRDRLNNKLVNTNYPDAGFLSGTGYANKPFDKTKGYSLNSSDVLIPAFLAAYTGGSASSVDTNPFLSLLSLLPNWRVTYDGLSRIQWVKDHFKSVSLTHAYTCRYSIGSYTSYSTWVALGEGNSSLGYVRDVQTNDPIPSSPYDISNVSLSEQFSPLLGINTVLNNSMTAKLEYRKQRNFSLNITSTQLVEATSDEYVVGLGYILKDFDVILRLKNDKQTQIKNDLKLSADYSLKDVKSLLRKVEGNITQASSGNKVSTIKIIADYVFSSKVNIQLFYDWQSSSPLISSSYPVSSSNFGVSFKFMLTR